VDVNIFSDSTERELRQGIESLRARGMNTLIHDLRNNPGGLLEEGIGVADLFLSSGDTIVSTRGRTPSATRTYVDRTDEEWPELRVIALVNGGSASASEIVAGALQDHDRALLIGNTTYGKGSAQSVYELPAGGAVRLTTARWYTPSGRSIQADHGEEDAGLAPDEGAGLAPDEDAETYRTSGGRKVEGGGGIMPDMVVPPLSEDSATIVLQRQLGADVPRFRDALTETALSLKSRGAVTRRDFSVSSAMRQDVWNRLRAQHVALTRKEFDASATVIDRLLEREIARYVFGPDAEFLRRAPDDPFVAAALHAAEQASSTSELLAASATVLRQ
jgi:carboxyl-terminal processing protease